MIAEILIQQEKGQRVDLTALLAEHAEIAESLQAYFQDAELFDGVVAYESPSSTELPGSGRASASSVSRRSDPGYWTACSLSQLLVTTDSRSSGSGPVEPIVRLALFRLASILVICHAVISLARFLPSHADTMTHPTQPLRKSERGRSA